MDDFGGYLVERGVISAAQFEDASQAQVVFGGRLGTNLVELGYLNLSELGRHLSDHLAVPRAPKEWLEKPESDAHAVISNEMAAKHKVLPLHLEKRTLHLAMLDPRDPVQLDEISFATGLSVKPYVVAEVQLLALLEHHYDVRRELRYINLGREQARGRLAVAKPAVAKPAAAKLAKPIARPREDLIDEATFSALHDSEKDLTAPEPAPVVSKAPELRPADVPIAVADLERPESIVAASRRAPISALETELLEARDRDAVGECLLRLVRRYCSAAALFVVRGGVVSGFLGDGDEIAPQISGILLPIESDCTVTSPSKSRSAIRCRQPYDGLDAKLLDSLGRSEVFEVAVHPIQIRGQVVNLLYTDSGPAGLGATEFAAASAAADLASTAYERMILRAKEHLRSE